MKRSLPAYGLIWMLSIWVLACQPETISPASELAAKPDKALSTSSPQAPPQQAPPAAPARNCQITIVNASSNPYAHMSLALGTPDMDGLKKMMHCPIVPGAKAVICLPQGEHTLYTFSNMYQFSNPIKVSIGTAPQTLRLKSGH